MLSLEEPEDLYCKNCNVCRKVAVEMAALGDTAVLVPLDLEMVGHKSRAAGASVQAALDFDMISPFGCRIPLEAEPSLVVGNAS